MTMQKLLKTISLVTLFLVFFSLSAQNTIPKMISAKRIKPVDFEGRGYNLTLPDADANNIYCGIINPVLEKYQRLPLKEFSIWQYIVEGNNPAMLKIHAYRYPDSESFIPLHFEKKDSKTTLYALQAGKLTQVEFTESVVRKRELAGLANGIKIIKADNSEHQIELAYISESPQRSWVLAQYNFKSKTFSQKVLQDVPRNKSDTTLPLFIKDGILFITSDPVAKKSVIYKTDRQGNYLKSSAELPLYSTTLVLGVDDLITCGGEHNRSEYYYIYVLNSELKVMLNFDFLRNYYDGKPERFINQLCHVKQGFISQQTYFTNNGDYFTSVYMGGTGGGGGGPSMNKSWGIGIKLIAEKTIVAMSLTLHADGVVRPNCTVRNFN